MKVKIIKVNSERFVLETAHTGRKPMRTRELTKDQVRATVRNFFNEAIEQRIAEAERLFEEKQNENGDDFDIVDFKESVMEE